MQLCEDQCRYPKSKVNCYIITSVIGSVVSNILYILSLLFHIIFTEINKIPIAFAKASTYTRRAQLSVEYNILFIYNVVVGCCCWLLLCKRFFPLNFSYKQIHSKTKIIHWNLTKKKREK